MRLFSFVILVCLTTACANVKPWERAYLADPIMTDVDKLEKQSFDIHMHRALAQGLIGGNVAGGGCGCEQ